MKFLLLCVCAVMVARAQAQTHIQFDNQGTRLDGYFYAAQTTKNLKAPAVVTLHGCGGMLEKPHKPNVRSNSYARLLNQQGWHVLFVDSLSGRNKRSVCRNLQNVSPAIRVGDVQAALQWLNQQAMVDSSRLGVVGWSHGGSSALLSSGQNVNYAAAPRAFVAFYPSCDPPQLSKDWRPQQPVLMLLGESDDWTPPATCKAFAARYPDLIQVTTYAHAHHGFDSAWPVSTIKGIISPATKKPVHAGKEPTAKAASQTLMIEFLKRSFQ